ncbi:hypothetical protein PGT30_000375 [Yersinia intermedia]|nr:hypothetical protein [Yersinia intermedia]MDA5512381.1 hypothetical protein [Yersinia intermedia]
MIGEIGSQAADIVRTQGDINGLKVAQDNKEFDALSPTEIKDIPGGRVGKLPDGRTVIVRERSTDGRPTLEIQSGKNRIKFRYDE